MSICQDASTNFLRDYGYNPIRLPSSSVQPYDILFLKPETRSKTSLVGSLENFTASPGKNDFPLVSQDIRAVNIEGINSNKFQIDFGLSILGNILSALGSVGGNLKTSYEKAQNIQFTYSNVSLELIRRGPLANFLKNRAKPRLDSSFIQFFDEEGEAFIITEVAKSDRFEVEAFDENGVGLEVDVNYILGAIGTDITVAKSADSETKLVYQGKTKISFAFKAVPFWLDVSTPTFKISPFGTDVSIAEDGSESGSLSANNVLLGNDSRRLISIKKASIGDLID